MRITGGILCGRRVEVPSGPYELRPAMDRMRESVFAIVGDLTGISFLDLFSGSGIIGLEAASRGASRVTCVERDREKFPILLRNTAIASIRIDCKAIPVERFILRNREPFDMVFLDPPFPYAYKQKLLDSIDSDMLLKPGGLAIIHFPHEERLEERKGGLFLEDERHYGRSTVRFYRRQGYISR